MQVFVQTRGTARAADYAFLGGAPPGAWWRAYREVTAFDHPTVLVTSDGERWAAYLSGIPSARVDAVGTVVRYTLVLDGPCGAPDAACVAAGVAAWLDDVAEGPADRSRLPAALDARFPPDDVARWLAGGPVSADRGTGPDDGGGDPAGAGTRPGSGEVRRRALAALGGLPPPAAAADEPGSWIGAVGSGAARVAFTARVRELTAGRVGRALLLNLVGGPDDAAALLDPAHPVAVLVESSDPRLSRPTALGAAVEAKKAAPPPPRRRAATVAGIALLPPAATVALVTMLVLAVLAVLAVLL